MLGGGGEGEELRTRRVCAPHPRLRSPTAGGSTPAQGQVLSAAPARRKASGPFGGCRRRLHAGRAAHPTRPPQPRTWSSVGPGEGSRGTQKQPWEQRVRAAQRPSSAKAGGPRGRTWPSGDGERGRRCTEGAALVSRTAFRALQYMSSCLSLLARIQRLVLEQRVARVALRLIVEEVGEATHADAAVREGEQRVHERGVQLVQVAGLHHQHVEGAAADDSLPSGRCRRGRRQRSAGEPTLQQTQQQFQTWAGWRPGASTDSPPWAPPRPGAAPRYGARRPSCGRGTWLRVGSACARRSPAAHRGDAASDGGRSVEGQPGRGSAGRRRRGARAGAAPPAPQLCAPLSCRLRHGCTACRTCSRTLRAATAQAGRFIKQSVACARGGA